MATTDNTSKSVKAVVGAIFIAMPISVLIAVSGNITYSSGIATGFGFRSYADILCEHTIFKACVQGV